jgi:hypothetical protein
LKWLPRAKALELARRPYEGPNKLQKWEYLCAITGEWYKAKEVVVDHYPIPAGSILSVEDIGPFANNLFCETSNLRVLSKEAHDIHTLAEKQGISYEQAAVEKKVIASCKGSVRVQLELLSAYGYIDCTNAAKRRLAWTEIHNKEKTFD